MNAVRRLLIESLKIRARYHYEAYNRVAEGYSCGATIMQHISSEARDHAREFDDTMDQLAKLDSNVPTSRLTAS